MNFAEVAVSKLNNIDENFLFEVESGGGDDEEIVQSDSPLWLMGITFSALHDREDIKRFTESRLWITYRRNFPPIGQSGFTSDKGWGCMLRCGQMILSECFFRLKFGESWRWNAIHSRHNQTYAQIVSLFFDTPQAPFGIHQLALMGEVIDSKRRPVGTWFGPNNVAQALRRLCEKHASVNRKEESSSNPHHEFSDEIRIHVALDNTLIIDEVKESARTTIGSDEWRPTCLFIPLRLGLSEMNPIYGQDVKECFEFETCVGILGGRPNHALYFIGCIDDRLIYLDPHTTQEAVNSLVKDDDTYHTRKHRTIKIENIDPSIALCFFCKTESDFDHLCQQMLTRLIRGHNSPLFEVCRERPVHLMESSEQTIDKSMCISISNDDSDDFEVL